MVEAGENQIQFLTRMGSLPMVTTAIGQLGSLYNQTKESNRLMRYTIEKAESSVKAMAGTAIPVISKTLPIGIIDRIACSQLDRLEQSYPFVTKPTDQVLAETKSMYNATLKPTVDRVTGMKDFGMEKYSTLKDFGMDKVSGVKTYGMDKLMAGNTMLNTVLVSTEYYVDQYLPAEEGVKETEVPIKPDAYPLTRLSHLSDKVRRRMFARAMQEIQHAQKRSTETLEKLNFTVNLLEYSRVHIDGVKSKVSDGREKLHSIWQEVNLSEEDAANIATDTTTAPTLEKRLIATARHLTLRLKHSYAAISSYALLMPGTMAEKIAESRKYTDELLRSLSNGSTYQELPQHAIDHMRTTLGNLLTLASQLTDNVLQTRAAGWFIPTTPAPTPSKELVSVTEGKGEKASSPEADHKEASSPAPEPQLPQKESTEEKEKPSNNGLMKKKDLETVTEKAPKENGNTEKMDVEMDIVPTTVKQEAQKLPSVAATVKPEISAPTAVAPQPTQESDGVRMKKKKAVKSKSKISPSV